MRDLSSKPAVAAVDQRDRQTDGRTLDRFMTLVAYSTDRLVAFAIIPELSAEATASDIYM